jgi:5-methylcytosine-specific restriction endonuclease McrA
VFRQVPPKVRLHIDHIKPISQGGTNDKSNLRVVCSACHQGRANIQSPSETVLNLLARIRKSSKASHREIYEKLKKKFESE